MNMILVIGETCVKSCNSILIQYIALIKAVIEEFTVCSACQATNLLILIQVIRHIDCVFVTYKNLNLDNISLGYI